MGKRSFMHILLIFDCFIAEGVRFCPTLGRHVAADILGFRYCPLCQLPNFMAVNRWEHLLCDGAESVQLALGWRLYFVPAACKSLEFHLLSTL